MFESLISFEEANERPWLMFVWAFIICSIAVLIAAQINYRVVLGGLSFNLSGLFAVVFAIIPSVYFTTLLIRKEELLSEKYASSKADAAFWERHGKDVMILLFFFFGMVFAFAVWTYIMPGDFFQVQSSKISQIHGDISGQLTEQDIRIFNRVLANNLQVTIFSFMFSLFFGAGAVFIIVWNASILGVFVGQLSRHWSEIPHTTMGFLPHGIPEIAGYLCAGLAGGLISAAILRGRERKVFKKVLRDCLQLFMLGVFFIFLGAGIETLTFEWQSFLIVVFYSIFAYILYRAVVGKYGRSPFPINVRKRISRG